MTDEAPATPEYDAAAHAEGEALAKELRALVADRFSEWLQRRGQQSALDLSMSALMHPMGVLVAQSYSPGKWPELVEHIGKCIMEEAADVAREIEAAAAGAPATAPAPPAQPEPEPPADTPPPSPALRGLVMQLAWDIPGAITRTQHLASLMGMPVQDTHSIAHAAMRTLAVCLANMVAQWTPPAGREAHLRELIALSEAQLAGHQAQAAAILSTTETQGSA
ncbi:hypothetical protein UFOVP326_76 [uncultured Caudovirales phage]|uniref:Uncharacterized protein n=1 Tax=uncultured Caudovirales phage TaxID=2100421 RepID=A0A6J5LXH7_9CAUD|nr:hypothetical protein UFOVP326_76 [uncultured Caudovirales phage]